MADTDAADIQITYRGSDAKAAAEKMRASLGKSGMGVGPVAEVKHEDATLGAMEIVITLIVTAAAKTAAITSLDYLEKFFRSRAEADRPNINVQVVIRRPESPIARRYPANWRQFSNETIATFFAQLREAVSTL